jgi:hypothetical protein
MTPPGEQVPAEAVEAAAIALYESIPCGSGPEIERQYPKDWNRLSEKERQEYRAQIHKRGDLAAALPTLRLSFTEEKRKRLASTRATEAARISLLNAGWTPTTTTIVEIRDELADAMLDALEVAAALSQEKD